MVSETAKENKANKVVDFLQQRPNEILTEAVTQSDVTDLYDEIREYLEKIPKTEPNTLPASKIFDEDSLKLLKQNLDPKMASWQGRLKAIYNAEKTTTLGKLSETELDEKFQKDQAQITQTCQQFYDNAAKSKQEKKPFIPVPINFNPQLMNTGVNNIFAHVQSQLDELARSESFTRAAMRQKQGFQECLDKLKDIHSDAYTKLTQQHDAERKKIVDAGKNDTETLKTLAERQQKEKKALIGALNTAGKQIDHYYHNALRAVKARDTDFINHCYSSKDISVDAKNNLAEAFAIGLTFVAAPFIGIPLIAAKSIGLRSKAGERSDFDKRINEEYKKYLHENTKWDQFVFRNEKYHHTLDDLKNIKTVNAGYHGLVKISGFGIDEDTSHGRQAKATITFPKNASDGAKVNILMNYYNNLLSTRDPNNSNECAFKSFNLIDVIAKDGNDVAKQAALHILTHEPDAHIRGFYGKELEDLKNQARTRRNERLKQLGLAVEGVNATDYNANLHFEKFKLPKNASLQAMGEPNPIHSASIKPMEESKNQSSRGLRNS